jgi:hypothetical protein
MAKALNIDSNQWQVLKLYKRDFKIALLSYPTFFEDPYPPLNKSYTVDLSKLSVRAARYTSSENPPIVHRRETLIAPARPQIAFFSTFSRDGEAIGLYGVQHGIQVLFHGSSDHLVRGDPDPALIDLYNLTLCYRLFGWSSLVCNIGLAINVLTNWGHLLQKSVHDLIYVINVRDKSSALCVRESRLGSVGMSWFDLGSCVRCF